MGDRNQAISFHNQAVAKAADKASSVSVNLSYQMFCSAVAVDPTFAEGWAAVAEANGNIGWLESAVAALRRTLEGPADGAPGSLTDALKAKTLTNLGHRLFHLGRIAEAHEATTDALALDNGLAMAWCNLSLIEGSLGDMASAIHYARRAFDLDPQPVIETALAFALLFDGQFAPGLRHFEARYPYMLQHFLSYPYPQWKGEPDKTVFLVSDQGLGDTLSFARFLEAAVARCQHVHVAVQPELQRLFRDSFGHMSKLTFHPLPCSFPQADCWSTFMSLPTALGLSTAQIKAQSNFRMPGFNRYDLPPTWKSTDCRLHIGICYEGAAANGINRWRSIPVTKFLELYRVPGIQLYSLQVGDRVRDLHETGCAALIRDLSPHIRDATDTIAILKDLDLVISIESFLPHLCGAIEKPCWIPYSYNGRDWRVGYDGSSVLWNPHHRVFKQDKDARWEPVFDRIVEALRERVGG